MFEVINTHAMKNNVLALLLVGILLQGSIADCYTQSLSEKRKWNMIDSADEARIDMYLMRCFPELSIHLPYKKDSVKVCSLENAFRMAPDVNEDDFEKLKKFTQEVSTYYNSKNIHILFQYGLVPGDVDIMFDRMFNKKEIFVSSPERNTTHQQTIELIAAFNKITDSYVRNKNKNYKKE